MTVIRAYDHRRDAASFRALNQRTFRDSVPPGEPVNEAEFRKHHAWLLEHFAPQDPARSTVFVAEVDGRYAGHIWIGTQTDFFTRRTDPWIFDISVLPEFRRKGIARRLHDQALQHLRATRQSTVGLQVMAHNEVAAKFYARLGYQTRASSLMRRV